MSQVMLQFFFFRSLGVLVLVAVECVVFTSSIPYLTSIYTRRDIPVLLREKKQPYTWWDLLGVCR